MKVEREHRAADDSLEASNIAMFRSMLPLAVREKFKRREAAAKRKKEQEEKKAAAKKEDEKEKKLKVAAAAKAALASKTKPAARGRSTAAASSRAASVSASAASPKGRGSASTSATAASPPTAAGASPTAKGSRKSAASPKAASPKGKQATARASAKKEATPAKATTAAKKTSPKKAAPKKASPKKAAPKKAAPKKAAPKKVTAKKSKNDPSDEDDDAEYDDEPLSLRAPVPATPASTRAKPPLATPASMVLKAHSASPVGRKSASPAEAMRTRQLGATITTRTAAKTAATAAVADDEDAQLDRDADHTATSPKKASPKKPAPKAKRSRVVKVNTPVVPERPRRGAAAKSAGAAGAEGYEISEQEAELATAVAAASSAAIRASIPTQVDPRKRFLPTSPINGDMPPPPSASTFDTHVDDFGPSDGGDGDGDAMPTAVRERVVIRAPRPLRGALEACAMYLITQISDDDFGTVSMETVRSDVAALLQVDGPLREEEAKIVDQQIIIRAERRIRAASRSMARSARSSLAPSLAPSASIAPSASVPGTPVSVLGTPNTSNRAGQQSMILSQGVTPTPPVPSFNDPSQLHPASPRVSGNANASALVGSSGDVGGTNTGAAATSMSGVFTGIAGNKSMDLLGSSKAGAVDATAAAAFAAALASGSSGDIAGLAAARGSRSGGPSTQESFPSQRLSQGAPVAAVGAGGFSPVKAAAKLSFSEPPTRDDKTTAAPSAAVSASPRKIDPKTGLPPGVVQFGVIGPLGLNPLLTPPPTPPQVNLRGQVVAPGSLQSSAIKKAAPTSFSSHVESIPLADTQTAAAVFSATTAAGSKSVGHKKRSRSVSPAAASTRGGGNTINTLPRDAVTPQRSLVQGVRSPGHGSGGAAKGEHRRTPLATVPGSPYTVIEAISDESDARASGGSGRASNTAINTSTTQLRFDDRANAMTEVPHGTSDDGPKVRTSGESVSSALDSQAPLFSAATSMAPGTAGDRSPLEVKLNAALAARLGDGPTPQLDASHHSGNESHASGGGGGSAGGADGSMVAMTEGDSIVRGYGSIDQFF